MIKGYKATYNYKCLDKVYKIGQEYKLDEKPRICKSGFHYCLNAKHTTWHYLNDTKNFKLLEIEDLNPTDTIYQKYKFCSNHIKIIREITDPDELFNLLGELFTFDENDNVLSYKDSSGYWSKSTYNECGKILTMKTSRGINMEFHYDEVGKRHSFIVQ